MAKKTIDWETVAKGREVLSRVETLVKEGAAINGALPQEMCDELNALTGNNWKGSKYKEFCDTYDWPWAVEEVVYALFHNGKYPEKNGLHGRLKNLLTVTRMQSHFSICVNTKTIVKNAISTSKWM